MTAYSAPSDPTNVVGKRIGAWILDLVVYLILAFAFSSITGGVEMQTYDATSQEAAEFYCDAWQEENDGFCGTTSNNGEHSAMTIKGGPGGLLFWAGHLAAYALVQGLAGGSLGKLAVGLRVVDENGQVAGIGRSFVRTIAWILDAITCAIPVIGGVLLVSTKGHRRLGDMIAGTYVVDKDAVGQPVTPGISPNPGQGAWGTPGAGSGWPAAGPGGFPGSPTTGNPWTPSAGSPPPGPGPVAPSSFGGGNGEGPTWDPARNAYIQYDRDQGRWLQWDDNLKTWSPISQ